MTIKLCALGGIKILPSILPLLPFMHNSEYLEFNSVCVKIFLARIFALATRMDYAHLHAYVFTRVCV